MDQTQPAVQPSQAQMDEAFAQASEPLPSLSYAYVLYNGRCVAKGPLSSAPAEPLAPIFINGIGIYFDGHYLLTTVPIELPAWMDAEYMPELGTPEIPQEEPAAAAPASPPVADVVQQVLAALGAQGAAQSPAAPQQGHFTHPAHPAPPAHIFTQEQAAAAAQWALQNPPPGVVPAPTLQANPQPPAQGAFHQVNPLQQDLPPHLQGMGF